MIEELEAMIKRDTESRRPGSAPNSVRKTGRIGGPQRNQGSPRPVSRARPSSPSTAAETIKDLPTRRLGPRDRPRIQPRLVLRDGL